MVLITGDSTRTQPELLLQDFKAHFLYKPFSRSELIDAVSRVLANQPSGEQST
jgi:FixJ family two-component response regulator